MADARTIRTCCRAIVLGAMAVRIGAGIAAWALSLGAISGALAFEVPITPFSGTTGIADFTDRDARARRRESPV